MTRIIHTADWHLGARLVDCDRLPEQAAFLDWLLAELESLRPDLLIVAGDVFDGTNPPQEALNLYYNFLARLAVRVKCQTLVLGGNHDSPATLHAPRELLRALAIRVIASPANPLADAFLELKDAVVCAVPFLRERDVRTAEPGQSADTVAAAIRDGITQHYRALYALAREKYGPALPLIATGHLTTVGNISSESERRIHVGTLGAVHSRCFDGFAYVALGHIHRPQVVEGHEHVRYSGSPIPLSFDEVELPKEIRLITLDAHSLKQEAIRVPSFRPLLRLNCMAGELRKTLTACTTSASISLPPWVELSVSDGRSHPDLDRMVRDAAGSLSLRVLKIIALPEPERKSGDSLTLSHRSLDELTPTQVFKEKLLRAAIDPETDAGKELMETFQLLLNRMQEEDIKAKGAKR
ncbi:MAG: exonuclease SbcCD subunit D C-terminal domain-containing protein [Verrucomicrobiota bacterium]|nr:exonuclease SbcCD subunit D C-terminal domain-containing protein [Verrucomicrobiota bacterium]